MLNVREVFILDVKLIKLHRRKVKKYIGGFVVQARKHTITMILFLIFLISMIIGSIFVKSNTNLYNAISEQFKNFLIGVSEQSFLKIFLSQVTVNIILSALIFIFGLCGLGFPVPIVILFIKGISIGALSSFLYTEYTLKGFGFCMLIFYPIQVLLCLNFLHTGKEGVKMSTEILRFIIGLRQKSEYDIDFRVYLLNSFISFILILIINLVSALLLVYVHPMFNF